MEAVKIDEGIFRLGVNIDEPGYLFEGLWPIPDGTSINAYVVKADKTAIIDLTQNIADFPENLEKQLATAGIAPVDLDYIVVNHMEPDHSGFLGNFKKRAPKAEILCSAKAVPLIKEFSGITEKVRAVKDGETLDLGGRTLQFFMAPNVHWPETMVTYETTSKVLFSCDAFGSYGKVEDAFFDDQCSVEKTDFYEKEALRYYANIVASFSSFVQQAIEKLGGLDIKVICPSHGIMWRENPGTIIQHYQRYVSYMKGPAEPEITVIWGSMYGNTAAMVNSVVQGIRSENIPVHLHRVPQEDLGHILASAWRSAGLVFGMPTYEYKMFPPMAHIIFNLLSKKVGNKKAFRFGSYGWSGGAQKELERLTEKAQWDFIESVEWQGAPSKVDLDAGYERGRELARIVKEFARKSA